MCGIVGYTGQRQATPVLLDGLARLEYRGYDSSGIAVLQSGGIAYKKAKGRLSELAKITGGKDPAGTTGIGHTRWATHGGVTQENAHPHLSDDNTFAVVHNGIIENYVELRAFLSERGFSFRSETDTEVISLLLEYYYDGDVIDAIRKVTNKLVGSYALGILHTGEAQTFYAVRKDSPLVIGLGKGENFIASDMPAVLVYTRDFIFPDEREIAVITPESVTVYNRNKEVLQKEVVTTDLTPDAAEKDGYPHFMLKEIHEQPGAIKKMIYDRLSADGVRLDDIKLSGKDVDKIYIAACGSAYHAGIVGKYFIEKIAGIDVNVELASEFRYRSPRLGGNCLTVIISQSGETADSLAALKEAKRQNCRTLGIVNVVSSSIAREADDVLYTRAGPEIAVATTKGYTTQVVGLFLLGLKLAADRGAAPAKTLQKIQTALKNVPEQLSLFLDDCKESVQYAAGQNYAVSDAYFIGRGYDFAAALEAALKLKEISYVHAEAYAAGELKHGTISLIEKGSLVIALATDPELYEKTRSNVKEVRSRGATVITVTDAPALFKDESDAVITLPKTDASLTPVFSAAALQLFAYYAAAMRGCDIDKPRNLAKSVTVE